MEKIKYNFTDSFLYLKDYLQQYLHQGYAQAGKGARPPNRILPHNC